MFLLVVTVLLSSATGNAQESRPYDGSWESLQKMSVPAWFDDGKIGIFIHWGPYSVIGYRWGERGYAEHAPKLMYQDPEHYYPVIKKRWGATPPDFGYKDVIPEFTAENWNPDEWAELFADVGATYVVMTAEHHDGFAMWDSELTPWNAVDKGPRRDLVGDLGKAVRSTSTRSTANHGRISWKKCGVCQKQNRSMGHLITVMNLLRTTLRAGKRSRQNTSRTSCGSTISRSSTSWTPIHNQTNFVTPCAA
jgi:hypothetical protein